MVDDDLRRSFERLGLSVDASMREVEKAFRELRDLYSEESLATYSLLDYADRQEKLESLQLAYDRILQERLHPEPAEPPPGETTPGPAASATGTRIVCVDADPNQAPGLYLRQMREAKGLSLHDIAERTKIGSYQLQGIEEQRFDRLPAPVYLRGFLREFAREVAAADVDLVVDRFMALYLDAREEG